LKEPETPGFSFGERIFYALASSLLLLLGCTPEWLGSGQMLLAIMVLVGLARDAVAVATASNRSPGRVVDSVAVLCLLRACTAFCPAALIAVGLVHALKPSVEHTTVTGLLLLWILMAPAAYLFQWCALKANPVESRGMTCMLLLIVYVCLDLFTCCPPLPTTFNWWKLDWPFAHLC
jgi:hypothetical protein